MPAVKQYSNREIIAFFKSVISHLSSETAYKYSRTVTEIDLFLTGHRLHLSDMSLTMADDWANELLRRGLAKNTVVRHLNILNSLLKSAAGNNMILPNTAPREMARKLTEATGPLPPLMNEKIFTALLRSFRTSLKMPVKRDVYEDMLILSLLNGAMPMKEVARLTKEDIEDLNEPSRHIAARNRSNERKFIFDVRQSYNTPNQLYRAIGEALRPGYSGYLPATVSERFDPDILSRAIWLALATKSGATESEARACLDNRSASGDNGTAAQYINSVNLMLTSDMPRWYVMHLRKGVDYTALRKEIAGGVHPTPELFYPSETIKKRIGNKTVIDDKPFISNTVFFKTYPEKILTMFNRIGDKAWCYRVTRDAGSPYAVIPPSVMNRFQSVIGIYTPDMEIHQLGELTPKPGESVIVIKGGYGNRRGEVEEVINNGSGSAIIRVKLSTDQGYEWRVDLNPQQLQRLLT